MLLSSFTGGGHNFNHSYYLSSKEIFDNLENSGMIEIIKIPISDTEYNYIPLLLGDGFILLKAFGFTSEHLKSVQKCQRDFISRLLNDRSTMKSISVKSVMDKKISIDVLNM